MTNRVEVDIGVEQLEFYWYNYTNLNDMSILQIQMLKIEITKESKDLIHNIIHAC